MSSFRYRHIVADYERRFCRQVRLPRCRPRRMGHVDDQLNYLEPIKDVAPRHIGNELRGDDVGVYSFKCAVQAAIQKGWPMRYGINWTIPPEQQTARPTRHPASE